MPKPVSQLGFAFVAWTRATAWKRVGFRSLPPLDEFVAVRQQKAFQARSAFELEADKLHDTFLQQRGISEHQHLEEHRRHLTQSLWQTEGRLSLIHI